MLNTYLTQTRQLLQNPSAPTSLYATSDLTLWVNRARQQVAGEGECVRAMGTLALTAAGQSYDFSSIAFTTPGVGGPNAVRQVLIGQGGGNQWLTPRPWEWFVLFFLNDINPSQGQPKVWSQLGQGQAGTLWFAQTPDQDYATQVDCACYPIDMVDDTTIEAIPALWTVAVPFFAAYLALLSAQSAIRQADADRMLDRYELFMQKARSYATPSVVPGQYPQNNSLPQVPQVGSGGGQQQ